MLVAAFLTIGVGTAMAAETPTWLCVPETAGQTVSSGGSEGTCAAKNTKVELPPTAELATLQSILPDIKYVASGVGGKPTIQFDAVNVQVVSGSGSTGGTVNGEGNLVIGYDENTGKHGQTGSHNLILGVEQTFTSYGGIVAGSDNTASGTYDSVTGGESNTASGNHDSITGGELNKASGYGSSVSGGSKNSASGVEGSWVGGGYQNTASGIYASIFGGKELIAEKAFEAIP